MSDTGNLTKTLRVAMGARVMLKNNLSLPDRFINCSSGTVRLINVPNKEKPLLGEIYVLFDDARAVTQESEAARRT